MGNRAEYVMKNSFLFKMKPDVKWRQKTSTRFVQDLKDTLVIVPIPHFVASDEPCSASQFLIKLDLLISHVTPAVTPYSFRDLELNPNCDKYEILSCTSDRLQDLLIEMNSW